MDVGSLQKGHRVSYFVLSVSLNSEFGGSRAVSRLRSKLARCIGQSVRQIGFFRNREACITTVACCETRLVVRKDAGPSMVPSMICAVNREQEGGGRSLPSLHAGCKWLGAKQ